MHMLQISSASCRLYSIDIAEGVLCVADINNNNKQCQDRSTCISLPSRVHESMRSASPASVTADPLMHPPK